VVAPDFVVDDAMLKDFREELRRAKIKIDEDGFNKDLDFIRAMIRFEIDRVVFTLADARRHLNMVDPQAQTALGMFGEAQKLTLFNRAGNKAGR
jgi:hypothetical protein